MFVIEIAGVRVGIDNKYSYIKRLSEKFWVTGEACDFSVSVTEEEIEREYALGEGVSSRGACESFGLYRKICEKIASYGVFFMHSAVVEVDGYAYAFTAKSGVGKSTHCALWLKNIPGARVVNGDKPLVRLEEDGTLTAFGTPWNGKECWGNNISAPLAAVCFIERGETNTIRTVEEGEAIDRLIHQLYLRGPKQSVACQLALMDGFVKGVDFYLLHCNISAEAAQLSYSTMKKTK